MKAMITGTTGQLGFELIRQVVDYPFVAAPISEDELDITDLDRIRTIFETVRPDLAEAILSITEQIFNASPTDWGIYHFCGEGITSWHRFAETIFEVTGGIQSFKPPVVRPITTGEYPTQAVRPAYRFEL